MKFISIISLLLLLASNSIAQEGTNFEDLTFQEALAKAKTTGKKLFIDCYTKTCGPCKYMVKFIFPLKECGEYFNKNYICIMKDMQEGEGIDIAQKYNVQFYPTYLFINHDGSLYCRMDGGAVSKPEDNFVQKVKNAIELTELNKKYAAGNREQAFLKKYITILQKQDKQKLQIVLGETMPQLGVKKLCEAENWSLIKTEITNVDTPLFRYLVDNRKAFSKQIGQQEVEEKIMSAYLEEFRIFKSMGIDFEKRIADLKLFEKDHYKGVLSLRYCMLFRQIIDNKQKDRIPEILTVLRDLPERITDTKEQMNVLQELQGFQQIANQQQKEKACSYLEEICKKLQPTQTKQVERIITRIK
ncbi:thioredoxin family protein [Butyricimonas paravirosa]|uniref:thioredoxin family protein n=1 Tax=Butyricimonas paravirosa TaxID=1472417 RepID=UPI0022E1CA68|nr:thioredoxin family protein [Butyricimonas paravirosa]